MKEKWRRMVWKNNNKKICRIISFLTIIYSFIVNYYTSKGSDRHIFQFWLFFFYVSNFCCWEKSCRFSKEIKAKDENKSQFMLELGRSMLDWFWFSSVSLVMDLILFGTVHVFFFDYAEFSEIELQIFSKKFALREFWW